MANENKILKAYRELKVINSYKELEEHINNQHNYENKEYINNEHNYEKEEEIIKLLKIMFELTPTGFEYYVRDCFSKGKYDKIKVTGWLNDWWIDITWIFWNKYTLIQCKKYDYGINHIKRREIKDFIDNTNKYRTEKYRRKTISLYFITTSRVNPEAKALAEQYNIEIRDCYSIIKKLEKNLDIYKYIEDHKNDKDIVSWIDIKEILDKKYFKQGFWKIVRVIPYYFRKLFHINYEIDYQKVEEYHPEKKTKKQTTTMIF